MDSEILAFRNVGYSYPQGRRLSERFPSLRREAVAGLTISVRAGECVALVGGNGSGKSTLLKLANGLLVPDHGEVLWNGDPIDRSRRGLARLRAEMGLLFQDPDDQLFAQSLVQDAAFGPLNQGATANEARERALDALERVGLLEFADLPPHVLSHGMRKRAALAGVLASHPRVLLLDEPTAGLDPSSEERFLRTLEEFRGNGGTVVLSTHDLRLARRVSDAAVVLRSGALAACGNAEDVLSDVAMLGRCGLAGMRTEHAMPKDPGGDAHSPARLLVLTGEGKGKTSSGAGMLLRAVGHGQTAVLARFVKARPSAEVEVLDRLGVRVVGGGKGFLPRDERSSAFQRHARAASEAWVAAESVLASVQAPALVVLDEICYALAKGVLAEDAVRKALSVRRPGVSVVCTGRGAPDWLRTLADTVSEVGCVKHGYADGIPATRGVEL